ncbi:galactan 5-O-arabinofuranosyltransferase [Amycolatopsis bartoniae]|uniref:galactan 5-O-arabinofuranosyltransferase n=1 Tax=Amycolatopsis bartoniae TaxID=941986 RepID=UPI0021A6C974|nr:galactan 5-O-arabinofuranosyltransferase [Amycolatopsis bartoniae]
MTAQDVRPAPAPAGPRLRPGRWAAELVLGAVFAALLSLVLQAAAGRLHITPGTYVPQALMVLASTVLVVVVFGVLAFRRDARLRPWLRTGGAWAALSALATLMLALPLQATRYYLYGASVDNPFRLQYMERMASGLGLADMNYADLPPYYPAGWFWLGGRFANVVGLEGWAAYKPYAITWLAITPVVAFALWSLVVRRRLALLASVATIFTGFLSQGVEEPYAWPTSAWLPPVAVLAWSLLRKRDGVRFWPLAVVGGYLGIAAVTYTLNFFFGVLVVVALAVIAGLLERQWAAVVRRGAVIAGVAAPLALVTWGPYLLAGGLGKPNIAAHHLPAKSVSFPTPFLPGSVFGVLCLAGLVWLLVRARQDRLAFPLLAITALVYVWFAASTLALAAHTTLLAFRVIVPLDVTLAVAGVFAAVELVRRVPVPAVALVVASGAAVVLTQTGVSDSVREGLQAAESDSYPTGVNARGQHNPDEDRAWAGQLISAINDLSGKPPTDEIVLSANGYLLSYQPYWGFQHTSEQYANPLADYDERNAEIRQWATSTTPAELLSRLDTNPKPPPNVFVLRNSGGALTTGVVTDVFPRTPDIRVDDVSFSPQVFEAPEFAQRVVGPFTVIVRR